MNKDQKNKLIDNNLIGNFINYKISQKNCNSYNPQTSGKRFCVLIACHTDNEKRKKTILNNINYFCVYNNIDVVIINSTNVINLENELNGKYIKYFEVDNDTRYVDFGKWNYALENMDYSNYDYIIFTNDSYLIHNTIHFFFNIIVNKDCELFAYTSSSEIKYHYQSYLFAIKSCAIQKFKDMFYSKKTYLFNKEDVIKLCELELFNYFNTKDCFLNLAIVPYNENKNIFFTNDLLYNVLRTTKLLPFIKLLRIN
jgi:hypothetical protein